MVRKWMRTRSGRGEFAPIPELNEHRQSRLVMVARLEFGRTRSKARAAIINTWPRAALV
jgi:hypothetical protein